MTLDFGTRSFRVGFDEHLMPFVRDAEGKRLDALPRAAKSDDKEKAAAAWATWKALRSEAEKVAKDQVARLERMMGDERKVAPDIFLDAFVKHPLVSHLARRLVWGAWNAAGELTTTFRVSEDGSFATIEDDSYALPADVEVGVAHPMALDAGAVMKWSELLASYEIVQPFGQLARRRDPIRDDELLASISGRQAPSGLLYGLRAHGWRAEADYDGVTGYRKVAGEVSFFLALDPPLKSGEKSMHRLRLSKYQGGTGAVSAVQLVEIAHQLENVLE